MSFQSYGFVLPCHAANIRGKLKHTYLTNKICLKTLPEDLLDSLLYLEQDIPLHQVICNLIKDLLELMGSLDNGFSPAQLVEQLETFQKLPAEIKQTIKENIHSQFVKKFKLDERQKRLKRISKDFEKSLKMFLKQELTKSKVNQVEMHKVQEAARTLIGELESLPKGIWLWETSFNGSEA